ncbi:hypothetical protein [Blastococcus sp. TF02A-30]|uniref:hypothetical protein n=1 Tax=Blastococcus sp. TF02A-30 TaxID=2250580 RepID=UPI000DE852F4|nr:hypothetical protein [Blastococcus sp. TF02A-30]RBY91204.1 hypothetical protein DQ241_05955 [Blastococcus sp. TF02A-30]
MPEDEERRTPTVVVLAAEHGGAYLWNHTSGARPDDDYVVDPAHLGVSPDLIGCLTAWNGAFEEHAARWGWEPPPLDRRADDEAEWTAWRREGLHLAYALQHELDALGHVVEVRYREDGVDRAVADRRGP